MRTFENEQSVVVCDLAIGKVHEAVSEAFGDAVQYTTINGQGTRVEAMSTMDKEAVSSSGCNVIVMTN